MSFLTATTNHPNICMCNSQQHTFLPIETALSFSSSPWEVACTHLQPQRGLPPKAVASTVPGLNVLLHLLHFRHKHSFCRGCGLKAVGLEITVLCILQEGMDIQGHGPGLVCLSHNRKAHIHHCDKHVIFVWVPSIFDHKNNGFFFERCYSCLWITPME